MTLRSILTSPSPINSTHRWTSQSSSPPKKTPLYLVLLCEQLLVGVRQLRRPLHAATGRGRARDIAQRTSLVDLFAVLLLLDVRELLPQLRRPSFPTPATNSGELSLNPVILLFRKISKLRKFVSPKPYVRFRQMRYSQIRWNLWFFMKL